MGKKLYKIKATKHYFHNYYYRPCYWYFQIKKISLKFSGTCLGCNNVEEIEFNASTFFDEYVNYKSKLKEKLFLCHRIYKKCKNFCVVDLQKLYFKEKIVKFLAKVNSF